jgi:hypothetical protein
LWWCDSCLASFVHFWCFEDIEVVRAARAAKDAIKGKVKRGRKRKSVAQEVDDPKPEVARRVDAPVPWTAPVARII